MPVDDVKRAWITYLIFLRNPADFSGFVAILTRVVHPIVERFDSHIAHFHFFFYSGAYRMHPEDGSDQGVTRRLDGVEDDENVAFIRLRLLVNDEAEPAVRINLLDLIEKCGEARGVEQPRAPYVVEEDFGARFGQTRLNDVMSLIEAASRLALSYARSEEPVAPSSDGQRGPAGLVHLVANTLEFSHLPG